MPAGLAKEEVDKRKKKFEKELEDSFKKHQDDMRKALKRALALVNDKVPLQDVIDARNRLTFVYLASGDFYQAVVLGEHLAHSYPQNGQAALAGAYALDAYNRILGKEEKESEEGDEGRPEGARALKLTKYVDVDQNRQRELAKFIEANCKETTAVDFARFQLGVVFLQEKKFPEAFEALARISAGAGEATQSRYLMAVAAQELEKNDQSAAPRKKPSATGRWLRLARCRSPARRRPRTWRRLTFGASRPDQVALPREAIRRDGKAGRGFAEEDRAAAAR